MEQHVAVPVRLPTPAWPEPMRAGALAMIQQVSKWRKSVFPGELPAQAAPWVRDLGISHNRRRISGRVVRVGSTLRPPFRGFLQARDRATGCAPGRYGAVSGVWPGVLAVIDEVLPVLSLRADPQGRRSNLLFGSTRLLRRLRRLAMTGSGVRHRRPSLAGHMSADRLGDAASECNARGMTPSGCELLLLRTRHRLQEERRGDETLPRAGSESRQIVALYTDDSGLHPASCARGVAHRWGRVICAAAKGSRKTPHSRPPSFRGGGRGVRPGRRTRLASATACTQRSPGRGLCRRSGCDRRTVAGRRWAPGSR